MSEYIKREDAIKALNQLWLNMCGQESHEGVDEAERVIRAVPSADVVEVRHGHWTHVNREYQTAICSECKKVSLFEIWDKELRAYNYCPKCGAKMDGECKGYEEDIAPMVEVVRCKDCRYYDNKNCKEGFGYCMREQEDGFCYDALHGVFKDNDYCSYGERKDGDNDA